MKVVEGCCRVLAGYLLEDHVATGVRVGEIGEIVDLFFSFVNSWLSVNKSSTITL